MLVIIENFEEEVIEFDRDHLDEPNRYKSLLQVQSELQKQLSDSVDIPQFTTIISRFEAESGAHILELVVATPNLCVYALNGYISG